MENWRKTSNFRFALGSLNCGPDRSSLKIFVLSDRWGGPRFFLGKFAFLGGSRSKKFRTWQECRTVFFFFFFSDISKNLCLVRHFHVFQPVARDLSMISDGLSISRIELCESLLVIAERLSHWRIQLFIHVASIKPLLNF